MINAPTYSLPAGTIIDKRYEIVRYISSGGFGITYEAIDKRFNSKVAVKELYLRDICNRDSNTDSISVNDTNISTFGSHKRTFSGFQDKHLNLYIKAIISRYPDARPEQKEKFKEIVSKSTIDLKEAVLAIARSDNENEGSNAEVKTNSKGDAKVNNKTTNKDKTEEVIVID